MRRHALAVLAAVLAPPAQADSFVLVHGAWVGEWAWDEVASRLRAEGHDVAAVSLKGQGLRAGEGGPDVSVEDHVEDVVAAVEAAPDPVILVAHSYGGRPATGAWDRARDLIGHVVYVESVAPLGPPPFEGAPLLPPDGGSLAVVVTLYPDVADSGLMPPPPTARAPERRSFAPMSLRALYGAVPASGDPLPPTPCTFVHAAQSSLPVLRRYGEALREQRGCELREVPGGHDVPTDAPKALAAILLDVAAES